MVPAAPPQLAAVAALAQPQAQQQQQQFQEEHEVAAAAIAKLGRKRRRPGEELLLMDGGGAAGVGSLRALAIGGGSGSQEAVAAEYATEMLQIMRQLRERCVLDPELTVKAGMEILSTYPYLFRHPPGHPTTTAPGARCATWW